MELFAEALSVMGALVLSVSFGLLVEELLFGGLVRLFFHRASNQSKDRAEEITVRAGGKRCLR
jgi:hypothetical protein